jgi:hypothetical protein
MQAAVSMSGGELFAGSAAEEAVAVLPRTKPAVRIASAFLLKRLDVLAQVAGHIRRF